MTTLAALADAMRMGKFPEWSPALVMRLGDELREALAVGPLGMDARSVLVDFGALDANDETTDTVDLLKILLPPASEG